MRRHSGFTLWELVWSLALLGTALSLAVPNLQRFVLDMRRTADVNAFVSSVQLARSEAAKRRQIVVVCKTLDRISCADAAIGYEAGWMVFANRDRDRPPILDTGEPLLFAYMPVAEGTIRSNRAFYEFRPFILRSTNGTVTFCDQRGTPQAKAVIVSYTGRPRTSNQGPGRGLICAGLP
jgi:type IV fimbrial biogenesis protein FimT